MSKSEMQRVAESVNCNCRAYSGRGMMGRYCLGIEVSNLANFLADMIEYINPYKAKELSDTMRMLRTDNLGHDMILYFPGTTYAEDDSDEDTEECDEDNALR